jgi:hypothetical protein
LSAVIGSTKQGARINDRTVRTRDFGRPVKRFGGYKTGVPAIGWNTSFSSRLAIPDSNILMTRSDVGTRHDHQRLHVVPHMLEAVVVVVMIGRRRFAARRRRTVAARPAVC